jgi:hypothetical protein
LITDSQKDHPGANYNKWNTREKFTPELIAFADLIVIEDHLRCMG